MVMLDWPRRPVEEQRLFNPAFLALVLRQTAAGYAQEAGQPLPLMLGFVAPAVVLHRSSRDALPYTTRADLLVWLQEHPDVRFLAGARARRLAPLVKTALVFGSSLQVLEVDAAGISVGTAVITAAAVERVPGDAGSCLSRARHFGRWAARSGSIVYQMTLWGVAP
jgi:hypothetical protein